VGVLLATAASAQARVKWPARCTSFACVNAHLNQLNARAKANATALAKTKKTLRQDEFFFTAAVVCEGDALVNETLGDTNNTTGITGEVGPIASNLGINRSTDYWPLFDPSLFPASRPANSLVNFRLALMKH